MDVLTIMGVVYILLQILVGWILADFLSGVLHWAEDRYGSPRWPIVGGAIRDTIRHHSRPMGMLKKSVWSRSWRVGVIAVLGLCFFALFDVINPVTLTMVAGAMFANEIHALAHTPTQHLQNWVKRLQAVGVIQSHHHHSRHHRGLKNTHFCTLTNWLNPVLEHVRFWRRLEVFIRVLVKYRPRRDPSVRRRQRRRWQLHNRRRVVRAN